MSVSLDIFDLGDPRRAAIVGMRFQDLAGHLARARAKVKPTAGARDKNSGGPCESSEAKQTGDDDDDDDGTAQELGLTAEVRRLGMFIVE